MVPPPPPPLFRRRKAQKAQGQAWHGTYIRRQHTGRREGSIERKERRQETAAYIHTQSRNPMQQAEAGAGMVAWSMVAWQAGEPRSI